jgi:hypothetical protein
MPTDQLREFLHSVGGVASDAAQLPGVTMLRFQHFIDHPEERAARTTDPMSWHKTLKLPKLGEPVPSYEDLVARGRKAEEDRKAAIERQARENNARRAAAQAELAGVEPEPEPRRSTAIPTPVVFAGGA